MPTFITPNLVSSPAIRSNSISDEAGTGSPTFPNGVSVAGPNRLADGTVSIPSIAFTNSTTTGLFRKAADSVGFSAAGVEIGFYANTGAWTFGPATGGGPISHLFRSGLNTLLDVRSVNGSITRIALSDGVNNDIYLRRNAGASASFDILSDATILATSTSAGAWTFGPSATANVNHVFRGRMSDGGTIFGSLFQAEGTNYQIKLERVTSNPGYAYIGADGILAFAVRNQSNVDVLSGTQAGAWTFGPATFASNHTINGELRVQSTATNGRINIGAADNYIYGDNSNNLIFGTAGSDRGGINNVGAWTFGSNNNYTNANRIDARTNGGLGFRYPTSDVIAHRIFVDDGSSIVSGQVPLVLQSHYTSTNSNRAFSLHSGAVSGTTNEIAHGLHGGAWTFGRSTGSVSHQFNGIILHNESGPSNIAGRIHSTESSSLPPGGTFTFSLSTVSGGFAGFLTITAYHSSNGAVASTRFYSVASLPINVVAVALLSSGADGSSGASAFGITIVGTLGNVRPNIQLQNNAGHNATFVVHYYGGGTVG